MNNLARTIGPAPSELPLEKVIEVVGRERMRTNAAILLWREQNIPKKKKAKKKGSSRKKKAKKLDNVASALAAIGMNRDQMMELLMKKNKEKGKNA